MDQFDDFQAAAIALDTYACNGPTGRRKDDPVYHEVTQGRDGPGPDQWRRYSSCADRAHWKLWRLGCRAKFVNRTAPAVPPTTPGRVWVPGVNISNLWNRGLGAPVLRRPGAGWRPLPGDELVIWNTASGGDAHSCSIVDYLPNNELATTANYGTAGMAPTPLGGCHFSDSPLYFNGKDWLCGPATHRRIVQAVLRLADLIPLFTEKPDLRGPEWSADFTGEVCDALGAIR